MSYLSRLSRVPLAAVLVAASLWAQTNAAHAARPIGELGKLQRTPALSTAEDIAVGGCPAVVGYYSRGAGENEEWNSVDWPGRSKYYGGVGEEMSVLANYLAEKVYPPINGVPQMKTVANVAPPPNDFYDESSYPAPLEISPETVAVTLDGVKRGATAFLDDINAIRAACPEARLVFVGYSQGAVVTRAALAATSQRPINGRYLLDPPAPGQSIALAFGDATWSTRPEYRTGTRYVGDTYLPTGIGNKGEEGLSSFLWHTLGSTIFKPEDRPFADPYPTPERYDLVSFCHGQDPSCQFARQAGQALGFVGHLDYDVREPVAAAGLVAQEFAPALRAAVPSPAVTIPEGQACLPRGSTQVREVRADGSPAGATSTVSARWQVNGLLFNGRPSSGASVSAAVSPGADATLPFRTSSSWFSNDVLSISAPAAISPTGTASLYQSRLCPTW